MNNEGRQLHFDDVKIEPMSRSITSSTRFSLSGIVAILVSGFAVLAPAQQFNQRHAAVHLLRSGALTVEVMDPDAPDRYYRGNRFSPVAAVLRAVLDGKDFLFSPVAHNPENENGGLAMEFDIESPEGPPGFADAAIGEGFLKIGVGVLRKEEPVYRFFKPAEMIEPARTTVAWGADCADFSQECAGINGLAYKLAAEVRLQPDSITIRYRLTNSGTKAFTTEQYVHNYFSFSDAPVGPDYEVQFPYDVDAAGMEPPQRVDGRSIFYEETLVKAVNIRVPMPQNYSGSNTASVRHRANGQKIVATTSIPGKYTLIHARSKYICPEQFVLLSLEPGKSAEWWRQYKLY